MSELNPKQREAAEFKEGVAVVVAIPGSGKGIRIQGGVCHWSCRGPYAQQ
jgi:hypothetical protein